MGLSLSWLAVKNKTASEIIDILHQEWSVMPWDNFDESPMSLLNMKNGWHVLECYPGSFFSKREKLVQLFSTGTEAIYCSIEENTNYCDAFCFVDGKHHWELKHHLHHRPHYLIAAGQLPKIFDDLQIVAKKKIEQGAEHDVMFDVVEEGCRQICGFKASSDNRKLTVVPIPFLHANPVAPCAPALSADSLGEPINGIERLTPEAFLQNALERDDSGAAVQYFKYLDEPRIEGKIGLELLSACCDLLIELRSSCRSRFTDFPDAELFVEVHIANDSISLPVWNEKFWKELGTCRRQSPSIGILKVRTSRFTSGENYSIDIRVPGNPNIDAIYYARRPSDTQRFGIPFDCFVSLKLPIGNNHQG